MEDNYLESIAVCQSPETVRKRRYVPMLLPTVWSLNLSKLQSSHLKTRGIISSFIRLLMDKNQWMHIKCLSQYLENTEHFRHFSYGSISLASDLPISLSLCSYSYCNYSKRIFCKEFEDNSHNGSVGKMLCAYMETWFNVGRIGRIEAFKKKICLLCHLTSSCDY